MPILDNNQIFYTTFEPKQTNRFYLSLIPGIPAYLVKGVGAISLTQNAVALNHINLQRYVKGKTIWNTISFTLYDAITPSGAQSVGPVGDYVSEWVIKGAQITETSFGDYSWDDDGTPVNINVTVQPDYCILNY